MCGRGRRAHEQSGLESESIEPLSAILLALLANAALGSLAYAAKGVDRSGLAVGVAVGTAVLVGLGWRGYLLLVLFFVLGTATTHLGYGVKAARRLAQPRGGRRGAPNVLGKGFVPAAAAILAGGGGGTAGLVAAYAAALAAGAADTVASEVGQVWGRRTVLLTSLRRVAPGTDGGVSLEGSAAGTLAALAMGVTGAALDLYGAAGAAIVTLAGMLGTAFDSVLGATLQRRGLLTNEGANLLASLFAALAAGLASGAG